MMPNQRLKQAWVSELEALEPDLVINTGDNLAHPQAVPAVIQSLGGLLSRPGLFVFGSNDYFGPTPKNPFKYFKTEHKRTHGDPLPWQDLRAAFVERGWLDATHSVRELEVGGVRVSRQVSTTRTSNVTATRPSPDGQSARPVASGSDAFTRTTVLDRFADDGYDLVLAGHTHGGQLCLPLVGALVTNCHLDRSRVKRLGLGVDDEAARQRRSGYLAVCAGTVLLPARGSLLTLTPVSHGDAEFDEDHSLPQLATDAR